MDSIVTNTSFNVNINNNPKYYRNRNLFKWIKKNIINNCKKLCNPRTKYVKDPELDNNKNKNSDSKIVNKKTTIITHILHFFLFFLTYLFYFLSLRGCTEGEDICTSKHVAWIKIVIVELIISIIIASISIILTIYNKVSPLNLIHFMLMFLLFYEYSNGTIAEDHGYYNFVSFFMLVWFIILIELFIHGIIILIKSKYRFLIYIFLLLFIITSIIIYNIDPINCDDWPLGLNNTYLVNNKSKYGCQIRLPKSCTYKILDWSQDVSKITKLDCSVGKKDARKVLLETLKSPYVNKNTKRFGYPLTNNDKVGGLDGKDKTILLNYTYENMIDMDNITHNVEGWPEHIVDFSKNENGEIIVNLTFNDTLSQERKKLEKNLNPYSNNIMILYIDSVSRKNAMRQLKKTMQFFEMFMSYEGGHHKNFPDENFHSFQFFKYHSFRMFTPGNYPKLFYGNKKESKNLVLITKYLKENGYVTNYCSDECKKDNTRTYHNLTKSEMYDHQMLLCDPNIVLMNKPVKKCLYGNINSYHLYEYGKQFWTKYKDNRKFSAMVTNDGHESSLEVLKYSDDMIYNYLTSLYNQNLLKDTTILLLSDHGTTLPSIYYLNDFFAIEARLPMLYLIVNDRKNVSYYDQYYYLHENQQTFVTAYDFYNTIGHLLYGDKYKDIQNKTIDQDTAKSPLGESLFNYIDPMKRHPKNYESMDTNVCI